MARHVSRNRLSRKELVQKDEITVRLERGAEYVWDNPRPFLWGGALVLVVALAVAGWTVYSSRREAAGQLALASVIVMYAAAFFRNPDLQFPPRFTDRANAPVGLASGLLQGATGVSGPVLATYLHGFRMKRETYLFSVTSLYGMFGIIQIFAFLSLGSFTPTRVT